MAFFDKLGEKITSTSKDVARKTKDLTDIAKINMQISSEEDKIKNKHLELGKLYYELFHATPNEHFQALCEEITHSSNVIESSKRQILSIKGVKICTNCGGEIPLATSFCGSCGTKVEEELPVIDIEPIESEPVESEPVESEPTEQEHHCTQCESVLSADAVFCTICGEKVVHT